MTVLLCLLKFQKVMNAVFGYGNDACFVFGPGFATVLLTDAGFATLAAPSIF